MPESREASSLPQKGEPVHVDRRALISKVLARYPGEFTLFGELLQNADDAHSSTVEIHFETNTREQRGTESSMQLGLKCSDVDRWTFKNDGIPFRERDWKRLSKIADGNPDPAKVGAFGVGFYSVFSVTDGPRVSSAGRSMEFFWEDDKHQLFVRQGAPPAEASSPWTMFEIPLRERGGIRPGLEFLRFIATSIVFMAHLKDVRVFFNEHQIGRIQKTPGLHNTVNLPDGMKRVSPSGIFTVGGIRLHHFEIAAETSIEVEEVSFAQAPESLEGFDYSTEYQCPLETAVPPLLKIHLNHSYAAKLDLTVFIADADVKVNDEVTQGLKRCTTMKSLPSGVHYSLVYTGKDDYDLTSASQKKEALRSIFQGLRADLDEALRPRIFIGHSTSQTTGIGGHMCAPFIPTVERESIDLVDTYTAIWNKELLYIGGFLSRAVYEWELTAIQDLWEDATASSNDSNPQPRPDFRQKLHERFLHVLRFFPFHSSTPSPKVAQMLERSFYACSTLPPRFLSSVGVRYASDIAFDGHLDKPPRLGNIGTSFVISVHDKAVGLSPKVFPTLLHYLGLSSLTRFEQLGWPSDLEDALSLLKDAVDLIPEGHPAKPAHLNNLGTSLRFRFEHRGLLSDLEDAILSHENAVGLIPQGHPLQPTMLNSLGISFRTRFQRIGKLSDIEDAISRHRDAVDLTRDSHPLRPAGLYNLGTCFFSRFKRLQDWKDLDSAISALGQAAALAPHDHSQDKSTCLSTLGNAFFIRFQHSKEPRDLVEATATLRTTVHLTPDSHADKPARLHALAIACRAGFEFLGQLSDLDDAILNHTDAIGLLPDRHLDKASWLRSLALCHRLRFTDLGGPDDLAQAISRCWEAVRLAPDHAREARSLCDMIQPHDLERAIALQRQALHLVPDGHLFKAQYLNGLANCLVARFEYLGERGDLEEAGRVHERAVQANRS